MTAHPPRILTEGESSLLDAFANAGLEGDARKAALASIERNGLPTRRVEAYHYTDLRALLKGGYAPATRPDEAVAKEAGAAFPRLVSDAAVLHFRDGHYFDQGEAMPDGVTLAVNTIEPSTVDGDIANAVEQINTAFLQDSVSLTVAEGAEVGQTVGIAHAQTGTAGTLSANRTSITVGKGSTSHFANRACGQDDVAYLASDVVDVTIAEGATVNFTLSIEEGNLAQRLARLNVRVAKDGVLNLFILNACEGTVRQEINFDMEGEGSALNIAGINMVGGKSHIDITSRITHHAPNTTAEETFRSVATGFGRGIFQGQIKVAQVAQLTDARMACNTLLLSDNCDFSVKPELEIFADDVQCAHGATVTELEESYLFYLRARGISEVTARRMLINAFVAELLEMIENEDMVANLQGLIDGWMEQHV
ncbi:MAG: Fe-S cluster assembly protein SufD [Pseudomonadota bacterium]